MATFCGGRALGSLGATPDDIVDRPFEAIRFDPFPSLRADLERALAGESLNSRIDVRDLTFEAWSVPLRDERNQIVGATGVIVDITERLRLERLIGEVVEMDLALAPDLRSVTGDIAELEQVIMNLALNARDAMPAGGTLTIQTTNVSARELRRPTMASGAYVLMTIRDTGAGMDARVKERVFEPFFTTKPEGQGTGLGLSTVYGIVKQLNGFIWVESEIGQGSTFQVYLPVAAAEAAPELISPAPMMRLPAGRLETILLVEDEHTVRRFAKLTLERHGFLVIEAATPGEALSLAAASEQVSLLLTNVVMPRISGPELAERLKKMRPELPVLYMSGYPSRLVLHDGLVDSSMRLMSKPFTTAELIATVHETLGKP